MFQVIAVDNCTHHCVSGEPLVISLVIKSTFVIVTIGSRPRTVVVVVSKTGLSLCAPVLMIDSLILEFFVFKKSKVSINIILLLTTIPARAITPTPDITMPKGWAVTISPIKTPAVDIKTAKRINKLL